MPIIEENLDEALKVVLVIWFIVVCSVIFLILFWPYIGFEVTF